MKLLFIDCCVRGEKESRTYSLCESFLKEARIQEKEISVKKLSLYKEGIETLSGEQLVLRDSLIKKKEMDHPMLEYAKELAEADYILVGAPYWDLSFPACLKTYIEQTSVTDITFTYVAEGSVGLCKARKMMYISTAGGFITGIHSGEEYMKQICDFYGIGKFEAYSLQGIDILGADVDGMMEKAAKEVKALAADWIDS